MNIPYSAIKVYGGGKTWMAKPLRDLRDIHGYNIISRWIDAPQVLSSPTQSHPEHVHNNENLKRSIWNNCHEDCYSADCGIFLCTEQDGNRQNGALVEIGQIIAFNKPVYIIGTCLSFAPEPHSDKAWRSYSTVHWYPEITNFKEGFEVALSHYADNYSNQFFTNRASKYMIKHEVVNIKSA